MSRIVLVRHGETVWHAENRYAGRTDVALTQKGYAQAQRLAQWAAGAKLTSVWSSTLSRARLTASPSAQAAGLPLQLDDRLVELDFGRGEGLTEAEMRSSFPREHAAFQLNPAASYLPDGECPEHAADRGVAALQDIAAAGGVEGRSMVVAHNTLLRIVLCRLFSIPLSRYRIVFPRLANGTLTELEFAPRGVGLLTFNSPFHDVPLADYSVFTNTVMW